MLPSGKVKERTIWGHIKIYSSSERAAALVRGHTMLSQAWWPRSSRSSRLELDLLYKPEQRLGVGVDPRAGESERDCCLNNAWGGTRNRVTSQG